MHFHKHDYISIGFQSKNISCEPLNEKKNLKSKYCWDGILLSYEYPILQHIPFHKKYRKSTLGAKLTSVKTN